MLHSWQITSSTPQGSTGSEEHENDSYRNYQHRRRLSSKSSRIKACETCRRRKIRCDGNLPCEACVYYSRPRTCRYAASNSSTSGRATISGVTSRSSIAHQDSAIESFRTYQELFKRLFPNRAAHELNELLSVPRDELVELVAVGGLSHASQREDYLVSVDRARSNTDDVDASSASSPAPETTASTSHLDQLQPVPDGITSAAQTTSPSDVRGLTDEVNALSLSVETSTSFLGISSVAAAIRVICYLNSGVQQLCAKALEGGAVRTVDVSRRLNTTTTLNNGAIGGQSQTYHRGQTFDRQDDLTHTTLEGQLDQESVTNDDNPSSSLWEEVPLLRAYFMYVHPFAPMLDETTFRTTYMEGKRSDPRWLLLLNTVLALGSVADASNDHPHDHRHYWRKASRHLNIQCLNSTHIETIQALSLIGGLYLHYINEPRLANSIMGAASRLATSLGLHRELPAASASTQGSSSARTTQYTAWIDIRRRTWWTLFILDAWAGYGLSRPGMRRLNEAISTQMPERLQGDTPSGHLLALFKRSVEFCHISTQLEDSLAICPFLSRDRRESLDNKLNNWFRNTTSTVQSSTTTTPTPTSTNPNPNPNLHPPRTTFNSNLPTESHGLQILRNVIRWRHLNNRIIIHRPILLQVAVSALSSQQISPDEHHSVTVCYTTAIDLIDDISNTWQCGWKPCRMAGWNATWLIYQALMVPLILLFARVGRGNDDDGGGGRIGTVRERCRGAVERGLSTLESLLSWSGTAARSWEVVRQIYSVSLAVGEAQTRTRTSMDGVAGSQHGLGGVIQGQTGSQEPLQPTTAPIDQDINNNGGDNTMEGYSQQDIFPSHDYSVLHQVFQPMMQDQPLNDMFEALDWYPGWDDTSATGLYGYGLYDDPDARQ